LAEALEGAVSFDLYVWQSPRDVDEQRAVALVDAWQQAGGDPATSPFEPSTDIGWFHRELMQELPELDVVSDAVPNASKRPVWLSTDDEPPARVVAIRLPAEAAHEAFNEVMSYAVKYDLVVFDARTPQVRFPLQEMGAYADATFWPVGAIQAGVAGGIGAVIAIIAWVAAIPILSWVLIIVGGFMAVMAISTFIEHGRKALRARGTRGEPGGE
jgi:hypothetical protein